jgi:hypothetical protein
MIFDYCKEVSLPGCISASVPYTYHFQFSLSYEEVRKSLHKRGYNDDNIDYFINDLGKNSNLPKEHKILSSIGIIRDTLSIDKVDLGIDYQKKYEELVELLKPYKLEDDMSPSTTLKMILKYQVK